MARTGAPDEPPGGGGSLGDAMASSLGVPGTALPSRAQPMWRRLLRPGRPGLLWIILAAMGPGLITANAGNDAGGIATYASDGATYGYSLLWVLPVMFISLSVVQEMAARMGAATGKGLSDLIRENFSIHTTVLVMLALFVANGSTVISEFVGIAAAIDLVFPTGVLRYILLPLIALALWLLVARGNYASVERVLLAMTLAFFAYPISAVVSHPNWGLALHDTLVPEVHFNQSYLLMLVALIGTTITPYMQVYVQSAVAEKGITARDYNPERMGVYFGSLFAMLTFGFIILATAATLFTHHVQVQTAADAARALAPLAGPLAKYLFAVGLFGASVLAAAVLPLATAYSVSEALGVEKGINSGFREAPVFMSIFTGLIVLGVLLAMVTDPTQQVQVLILVQVINGLLLPVILFTIVRLVNNRNLMGDMVNGPVYNVIAWITAVVVSILSIVLLVYTVLGWFGL